MSTFVEYVNDTAALFSADTLRIPASYPIELLPDTVPEIELAAGDELERSRVCEFLRDGVVVARARLP